MSEGQVSPAPARPADPIGAHLRARLQAAARVALPFPHLLLQQSLPAEAARGLAGLPLAAATIGDTRGRRETHNATRLFLDPALQARWPLCAALAAALQDPATVAAITGATGARLRGSFLRIEYCQDQGGFWLEPHTDIGAKRLTLLIYLSDAPGAEAWGTDLYDQRLAWQGRAPAGFGAGLAFVPASDTWHGFEPRAIDGVRRSLIVNYVGPEWRARHELAHPDRPI